ncbi:MAG: RnfH family protein [Wenzhouxiangellaceae bacterium]|nr:MAG: RnfH family protein [Wenzhouxiangellaceae bacterium]
MISVEVVAGDARRQVLISLHVPDGTSAWQAVVRANLEEKLPGLRLDPAALGLFGRACEPNKILRDGDRVEVYRPLKADPKEVRRALAELEKRR